jgi:hypothetical protein
MLSLVEWAAVAVQRAVVAKRISRESLAKVQCCAGGVE